MSTWAPLALPLLTAVLLSCVPGIVVLLAAGQRSPTALLAAPAISVTLVAASAVVFGPTGLFWSVWMPLVATVVLSSLILLGRVILRRRSTAQHDRPAPAVEPDHWKSRSGISVVVAVLLGAALFLRHARNILGTPEAFSQTFDNIFHLSAIRMILDTGDASTLTLSRLNAAPGDPTYYPAAWHDLVSLVVQLTGCSLPVGSNAVMITAFFIWVASCLFLVRCVLDAGPVTTVATAVLAASFPAFPVLLTGYGVLYPNLLGYALAPVAIGFGVQFFRESSVIRFGRLPALGFLLLVLPGIGMAQPNAVILVLLIAVPVIVVAAVRSLAHRAWAAALGCIVLLPLIAAVWHIVRPPASQITWLPSMGLEEAFGRALLQDAPYNWPAYAVSALVVIGGLLILRQRRLVWLDLSWAAIVLAWVVVSSSTHQDFRIMFTGVWYNDPFRLAAALPIVGLPLAAAAIARVDAALVAHSSTTRTHTVGTVAITSLVAFALIGLTQWSAAMNHAVDEAASTYRIVPNGDLLTPDEYALIMELPDLVPSDAVVATNAWNGSSLVYPLTGIRTTTHHVLEYHKPDVQELNDHLDDAAMDPTVCPAIEDLGVDYALDFGTDEVHRGNHPQPGFDDLADAPGFELIAQKGDAKLYKVTACQ